MIRLGELVMILDLHRQGVSVSAIARQLGLDRKTVRTHIAKGLTAPAYKPRPPQPHLIDPFAPYLRERLAAFPTLTGRRLWRELAERGYRGGYTSVTDLLRDLRPPRTTGFEVRFETPPGAQAQVDFAQFIVEFTDQPGVKRIVWLFSMVLGYSRLIWARFVLHQDLQTVLRCHMAAFEAIGGVPGEVLYDRMKTAVIGEDPDGLVVYNRAPCSISPGITAISRVLAVPTGRRRRGKSNGRSATFAKTSSSPVRSGISKTSTSSCSSGWTRSPIRGCMQLPAGSSTRPSPRNAARCDRSRLHLIKRCSGSNAACRTKAWSASEAICTACRTRRAGVFWTSMCWLVPSASSRMARSSPVMRRLKDGAKSGSIPRIAKSPGCRDGQARPARP